jgi:hypothetical protein
LQSNVPPLQQVSLLLVLSRSAARFELQRSAAAFETSSAARFSAVGVLTLKGFCAAAVQCCTAVMRRKLFLFPGHFLSFKWLISLSPHCALLCPAAALTVVSRVVNRYVFYHRQLQN